MQLFNYVAHQAAPAHQMAAELFDELLEACLALGEDLDTLADRFSPYPQILRNVEISREKRVNGDFIKELSSDVEPLLGGAGRILIRPSGTEPLMRVLVEARDRKLMEEVSEMLVNAIREKCM